MGRSVSSWRASDGGYEYLPVICEEHSSTVHFVTGTAVLYLTFCGGHSTLAGEKNIRISVLQ